MSYGIWHIDNVSTGLHYFGLNAPRATPSYRIGKRKGIQRKSKDLANKVALFGNPSCAKKLNFD